MMTKYGTYVVYKCKNCGRTVEIPLHLNDAPPLEKYASFCTHEWEKYEIKENVQSDEKES